MTLPFALPDWLPSWVPIAVLIPALLYLLAFLFMPFSVIGLKSRLEGLEARMDEIQSEIRSLALRLPEPARGRTVDNGLGYVGPQPGPARHEPEQARPPIPPAPYHPDDLVAPARDDGWGERGARPPRPREGLRSRSEPRFGPPR